MSYRRYEVVSTFSLRSGFEKRRPLAIRVGFSEGWDLGKRFSVALCGALFAIAACGSSATQDAGVLSGGRAAVTPTQASATQALVTQAPPTLAPATAAPTAKPVGVIFTSVRSPVSRNGTGLAAVSTAPNMSCTIVVTYKSGASTAQGLTAKTSDATGAVSWTWMVGGNTTVGTWPIDVNCGGARGHATFVVQ
jgi:hypothetical protein